MFGDLMLTFIMMAYLVGGMTIGYYYSKHKNEKKRRGDGRWD